MKGWGTTWQELEFHGYLVLLAHHLVVIEEEELGARQRQQVPLAQHVEAEVARLTEGISGITI